jgi:hypothetical protein
MNFNGAILPSALSSFIPCYDGTPCAVSDKEEVCVNTTLRNHQGYSKVISGHFTTHLVNRLEVINNYHGDSTYDRDWNANNDTISLTAVKTKQTGMDFYFVVSLQEPIDRLMSHYYHFVQ